MTTTTLAPLAALLLTYLVHSTLLLGAAWALDRLVIRREAWRETLWKTALVGALLTTAATGVLPSRMAPRIELAALSSPESGVSGRSGVSAPGGAEAGTPRDMPAAPAVPAPDRAAHRDAGDPVVGGDPATDREPAASDELAASDEPATAGSGPRTEPSAAGVPWMVLLVGAWAVVAALLLGRLGVRHYRLHRVLRGRREVSEAGLPAMLAELRRRAGVWRPVRLTVTAAIGTPLVLGSREICVPDRFLAELGDEERRAALAHELGHLARRDPAWQLGAMLLESLFFFQPLHRVARLRLRESAEYLADGWAVEHTGSRLGLARCLAEVASWVAPSDEPRMAGTVAMAEGGSPLLVRVGRLLEREPEAVPRAGLRAGVALGVIILAAGFGPAVTPGAVANGSDSGGAPWGADDQGALDAGWSADTHTDTDTDTNTDGDLEGDADVSVDVEDGPPSPAERALAGQEVTVVRAPATGGLESRLGWARSTASARPGEPYWVGWAVPSVLGPRTIVSWDSRHGYNIQVFDGDGRLGRSNGGVASALGVADEVEWGEGGSDVIVLALMSSDDRGASVERLAVHSPVMSARIAGRVFWLGRIEPDQGVDWLAALYRESAHRRVALRALDAIAVHATDRAPALLRTVARDRTAGRDAREQAVEGFEYHPTDENLDLLVDIAGTDGDVVLRAEAVETIGELRNPRAGPALRTFLRDEDARVRNEALEGLAEGRRDTALVATLLEVALNDPDLGLRREAAELLGEVGTPEALEALDRIVATSADREVVAEALEAMADGFSSDVVAPRLQAVVDTHRDTRVRREALEQLMDIRVTGVSAEVLLELALHDDDPDLRREAVEQMAEMPATEAVPLLRRVAFESGDGTAERQAAESLGEVGTLEALAVLDEIVARNPSEDAAFQAVESIAENFSRELSLPRLRRILREHPSSRVRREALDQLDDLGGGRPDLM